MILTSLGYVPVNTIKRKNVKSRGRRRKKKKKEAREKERKGKKERKKEAREKEGRDGGNQSIPEAGLEEGRRRRA